MTRTVSARERRLVEMQGFTGLSDDALAEVGPWLRLAPAVCMLWTAVATWQASAAALWALAPIAFLGAILPGHPFDVFYNHGLRRLTGTRALPVYRAPRRTACAVATLWLLGAGWAFHAGASGLGYGLGYSLVAAAAVPVTTGFCIPSYFYGLVMGPPAGARVAGAEAH